MANQKVILFSSYNPHKCYQPQYAFLSNFYPSPFSVGDNKFVSNEQYFMWRKAIFFKDFTIADKIMNVTEGIQLKDPQKMTSAEFEAFGKLMAKIKKMGHQVKHFNQEEWDEYCQVVMTDGLLFKFIQNPSLGKQLKNTGKALLAESAPWDKVWGTGLSIWDSDAENPDKWTGKSWLGPCLMSVRGQLIND
jgi:ribA/ribD-fused uncharacterized protein